jgi:hypothetical protein
LQQQREAEEEARRNGTRASPAPADSTPAPAPVQETRHEEPVYREEPVVQRAEPVVTAPVPRVEEPRPQAPRVDTREVLASAGLQMVETDSSKFQPVQPESESVKLGRPRRERSSQQPAQEELVQVETRDK